MYSFPFLCFVLFYCVALSFTEVLDGFSYGFMICCFSLIAGCWAARRSCRLLLSFTASPPYTPHLLSSLLLSVPPSTSKLLLPRSSVSFFSPSSRLPSLKPTVSCLLCCSLLPPCPLLCPSSLFFLRALGGAPRGPVVEVFLHRPQPGPPPPSGQGAGPPPPPVLLPPPPLPKLAHLRPGPPRVPPRSAPGAPALLTPSLTLPFSHCSWFSWDCACVLWLTLMLGSLGVFLHACLFLWLCRLQAGVV